MSKISPTLRDEVREEVGDILEDSVIEHLSKGKSPLNGSKFKPILNKDYAKREKGGNRTPNLELDGGMIGALEWRPTTSGIEFGIFGDSGEGGKADGHNNFSGDSKLPTRRFIPNTNQRFDDSIMAKVNGVLNNAKKETAELKKEAEEKRQAKAKKKTKPSTTASTTTKEETSVTLTLDDILGGDSLTRLIREKLDG